MKLFKFSILLLIIVVASPIKGQQSLKEIDELHKDANSYYYFEDYEEAVALFLQVYNRYPNNYNLCFKIGVCYLNIPGYKQQAIPYLEKAASNTKRSYNEQSIQETKAPYDAVFYLGNAYFINNQLDKARKEYKRFKELIRDEKNWNLTYYNHQIETVRSSEVLQSMPVNYFRNNLGEQFNSRFANYNAVISGDGNTIAFTTKQRFYQAIFVSRKNSETWSTPVNITLDLQVDGNCSTLSLSNDGNELYLFKDDNQDGNIYVTHFEGGAWTPMKKLNETINTKYYETYASVSKDGKTLYFTSNRKEGFGDHDIYVSTRVSDDIWGPAINIGSTINSPMNEASPFISMDGTTLFFSSEGHNNIGGFDIFYSQKKPDGAWSTPVNIGYPINTTDDDLFYCPIGNGSQGLMAVFDKDGYGEQDICQLDIFLPKYQKSIITPLDLAKVSNDRINYILIDTINNKGIALTDFAKSGIAALTDPKKNVRLFFDGKEYELRDQVEKQTNIVSQLNNNTVNESKIPISVIPTVSIDKDANITEEKDFSTVQNRVNELKVTGVDSIRGIKSKNNSTSTDDLNEGNYNDATILGNANYLAEILAILSSNHSQKDVVNALQNNWHFPASLLKVKISQFAMAIDTIGNREELLKTFTRFIDLICSSDFISLKNQSRVISGGNSNENFIYLLKQFIDRASPELAHFIDRVYQKYPNINTFEKLWDLMRKEDPELFNRLLPEILRLLAEISIETYMSLPEDQKYKLYERATTESESRSDWWLIVLVLGYLTISTAGYFYLKRRNE